jgi:hypothetical protein
MNRSRPRLTQGLRGRHGESQPVVDDAEVGVGVGDSHGWRLSCRRDGCVFDRSRSARDRVSVRHAGRSVQRWVTVRVTVSAHAVQDQLAGFIVGVLASILVLYGANREHAATDRPVALAPLREAGPCPTWLVLGAMMTGGAGFHLSHLRTPGPGGDHPGARGPRERHL